jgi:hypothetical protein
MAARCGESNSAPIQLAVVKALLTFVTAEHFLVHGDSLMQAVRTVFNLAIGAGGPDIQSTAQSALLQMLNTVLKRVGQQVGVRGAGRGGRSCFCSRLAGRGLSPFLAGWAWVGVWYTRAL